MVEINYRYEKNTGQFRNLSTGRFAPLKDVETALDTEVNALSTRLGTHAANYADGLIDIPTLQTRMAEDIKASHLRVAAVGAGGSDRLTSKHYGAVGGRLSDEYTNYLYQFGIDLNEKEYSKGYIINRAKMYARSPKQSFNASRHITRIQDGANQARRDLDPSAEHCFECPFYSTNNEWVDANLVVPVGARCTCRGNCKCRIEYRVAPSLSTGLLAQVPIVELSDRLI